MIKTFSMLVSELDSYANPKTKINRLVKEGVYIPLRKGIYETDRTVAGYLLAGAIYGPSYLSFDFALSYYQLIPEKVTVYTSAAFGKNRTKQFENFFGAFHYRDVPKNVYPLGVRLAKEGNYDFQIASPEKALCDKLHTIKNVTSQKALEILLFDDLRVDADEIKKLDLELLHIISEQYKDQNVYRLTKWMEAHA